VKAFDGYLLVEVEAEGVHGARSKAKEGGLSRVGVGEVTVAHVSEHRALLSREIGMIFPWQILLTYLGEEGGGGGVKGGVDWGGGEVDGVDGPSERGTHTQKREKGRREERTGIKEI